MTSEPSSPSAALGPPGRGRPRRSRRRRELSCAGNTGCPGPRSRRHPAGPGSPQGPPCAVVLGNAACTPSPGSATGPAEGAEPPPQGTNGWAAGRLRGDLRLRTTPCGLILLPASQPTARDTGPTLPSRSSPLAAPTPRSLQSQRMQDVPATQGRSPSRGLRARRALRGASARVRRLWAGGGRGESAAPKVRLRCRSPAPRPRPGSARPRPRPLPRSGHASGPAFPPLSAGP